MIIVRKILKHKNRVVFNSEIVDNEEILSLAQLKT